MNCILCDRELSLISRHHLIPRSRRHNKKVKKEFAKKILTKKIDLCRPCHDQINNIFTEKKLERIYNNLPDIKSHPEISKFISWIKNKPINFRLKVARPSK